MSQVAIIENDFEEHEEEYEDEAEQSTGQILLSSVFKNWLVTVVNLALFVLERTLYFVTHFFVWFPLGLRRAHVVADNIELKVWRTTHKSIIGYSKRDPYSYTWLEIADLSAIVLAIVLISLWLVSWLPGIGTYWKYIHAAQVVIPVLLLLMRASSREGSSLENWLYGAFAIGITVEQVLDKPMPIMVSDLTVICGLLVLLIHFVILPRKRKRHPELYEVFD